MLFEFGGANKISKRAASELKCDVCAENKLPKVTCPRSWQTHTQFNQGAGVDLFEVADSNKQVFEFLNIVDLATRFNICFPVPSKRPDDVGLDMLGRSHESLDLGHGR